MPRPPLTLAFERALIFDLALCLYFVTHQELEAKGRFSNTEVVIAGLCNIYTHYITTYEEYQVFSFLKTIQGPPYLKIDCYIDVHVTDMLDTSIDYRSSLTI